MTELEDKMGRLLAWLVDDSHHIPMMHNEAKDYVKRYMKAAVNGLPTDNIPFREATNER